MKKIQKYSVATAIGVFVMVSIIGFLSTRMSHAQKGNVYYTCPMPEHSDVVMDKPGKCPKCGMDLVKKEMPATTKYVCPMPEHSDVVSDKPGKCPKCGMNLVPMKPDKK